MAGATVSLRVITLLSTVILMNMLDPNDFGVVGLVGVVLATASLFSGLGMGPAVIQSQADRGRLVYQGFVVSLVSGVVIFTVVFLGTPFFVSLLGEKATANPQVIPVLRWLSLILLFGALGGIPEALLQKDLQFGRVSIAVVVSELLNVGVSIGMAFAGFGLWSLVFGSVAKSVVYCALMWILSGAGGLLEKKPWDRQLMKSMLRYGTQFTGGGIVSFFYSVVDNLIVGTRLGLDALGLYGKAYDFNTRSVDSFINVVGVVLFPSYATIQNDRERLSRAYLKSLRLMSFFVVPVALGMFITAPEVITVFLKPQWQPMTQAFEVLGFVSLVKALSGSTGALFASTGYPIYNLRAGLLIAVIMVPLIFAGLSYGIAAVAGAVLVAHVVAFFFNMYQVHLLLPGTAPKMLVAIGPASAAGLLMTGAVQAAKAPLLAMLGGRPSAVMVVLMIALGGVVYSGVLLMLQRPLVMEVAGLALRRFGSRHA